jgi:hypothetical protein
VAERVVTGILHSDATDVKPDVRVCATTPEYLKLLDEGVRAQLKQGRFVHSGDAENAASVIVLGEKMATTLFPATDPVGQTISLADEQLTVVGVVTDGAAWGTGLTYDAYVPLDWLESASEGTTPFPYDRFRFRVTSMNEMESTEKVVRAIVDRRHPDHNVRVRSFLSDDQ